MRRVPIQRIALWLAVGKALLPPTPDAWPKELKGLWRCTGWRIGLWPGLGKALRTRSCSRVRPLPRAFGAGCGRRTACLALLLSAGCLPLDREEAVRQEVARLVFLAQTRDFRSTATCTAASFEVISDQLRRSGGAARVTTVQDALPRLQKGQAVAFDMPGVSPNAISEQLMSLSLPIGLGLVSAVVGPARGCMSEVFKADLAAILASPDTTLVYDPGHDAALLLYRPLPIAFFLRGNV